MYEICLTDSLEKVYGDRAPQAMAARVQVFPGERFSFQIAARRHCESAYPPAAELHVSLGGTLAAQLTVRTVELVPVRMATYPCVDDNYLTKLPGMLPDLLMPQAGPYTLRCVGEQWTSLWCDFTVPDVPGEETLTVTLTDDTGAVQAETVLTFAVQTLRPAAQTLYHTEWFHTDCLADYYGVEAWSEEHWRIVENYIRHAASLGINMLLTPVLTPALDTAVGSERTTVQLLDVTETENGWAFGFEKLDRWIALCRKYGITELEICPLFTQWGAEHAPKVMAETKDGYRRVFGWETAAADPAYTAFLRAMLTALTAHLQEMDLLQHTWFHVSDEPDEASMAHWAAVRAGILDLVRDCRQLDALSSFAFYQHGYIQTPVVAEDAITPFAEAKVPHLWTYYCCSQHTDVPNRFIAMPSARSRILGTLLYCYDAEGFLQWGYNFYNNALSLRRIDPFATPDGMASWPAGDPFLVYPGADGEPLDSIRSMILREAMQDLRLLRAAEEKLGREDTLQLIRDAWDGTTPTMFRYPTENRFFADLRRLCAERCR